MQEDMLTESVDVQVEIVEDMQDLEDARNATSRLLLTRYVRSLVRVPWDSAEQRDLTATLCDGIKHRARGRTPDPVDRAR